MVPSQDVDVRYQGWLLEGLVEGPSEAFSASFQVARLAGLPEGDACRGQLSFILHENNVLDVSPLRPPMWDGCTQRGRLVSRPWELARPKWLRMGISESSLKTERLLAEAWAPRKGLVLHPIRELTSPGTSFCFWLGVHYRSIEIAPYGGTVGGSLIKERSPVRRRPFAPSASSHHFGLC